MNALTQAEWEAAASACVQYGGVGYVVDRKAYGGSQNHRRTVVVECRDLSKHEVNVR